MENNIKCSFCGRSNVQVIESENDGKKVYICKDCASLALDLFKNNELKIEEDENYISPHEIKNSFNVEVPKPKKIKEFLDQYIIGQDDVKKKISVAVYNHYKRINHENSNVEIDKSNVLIIGPTGTGKTMIARTIAKMLNVPFAIADATTFTESGYVGDDVESALVKLYQAADYVVEKTERGIVFIDEIDKIARKSANSSITRDVSGEGVQQCLLKLLEDSIVSIPPKGGRKHPEQPLIQIDTKNILFICSGAFVGIENKIKSRCNKQVIGFDTYKNQTTKEDIDYLEKINPLDLRSFGLIPELIGRLPVLTHTNELTKDDLIKILTEPKNSLVKQYVELFKIDGIDLEFDKEALEFIAEHAIENKLGARGLRGIMENIMNDAMFDIDESSRNSKYTITKEYCETHCKDDK